MLTYKKTSNLKFIVIVITSLLLVSCGKIKNQESHSPVATQKTFGYIVGKNVILREGLDDSSRSICTINQKTKVEIIDSKTIDNKIWYKIKLNSGELCYVNDNFLSLKDSDVNNHYYINTDNVKMYANSNESSVVKSTISKGAEVGILATELNNKKIWRKIKLMNTQEGYIFNKYIETSKDKDDESFDNCNEIRAKFLEKDVYLITCVFKSDKTFQFTIRAKQAGINSYKVISGKAPKCFYTKNYKAVFDTYSFNNNTYNIPNNGCYIIKAVLDAGWKPTQYG